MGTKRRLTSIGCLAELLAEPIRSFRNVLSATNLACARERAASGDRQQDDPAKVAEEDG
jgi:hypothetical protein